METDVSEARGSNGFFLLLAIGAAALIGAIVLQGAGGSAGGSERPAIFAQIPYDQALSANASDGKLLVVKLTADWCGPCKRMNRETFSQPEVVAMLQKSATAIEVDIDEHVNVAVALNVTAIPTIVIYRDGKETARTGYLGPSEFKAWLARAGG